MNYTTRKIAPMSVLTSILIAAAIMASTDGCTSSCQQKESKKIDDTHLMKTPISDSIFTPMAQMDLNAVTEITLLKRGSEAQENWKVRLAKKENSLTSQEHVWIIAEVIQGPTVGDRIADTSFIDHLLDSLRALQFQALPKTTGEIEEKAGLTLPGVELTWSDNRGIHTIQFAEKGKSENPKTMAKFISSYLDTNAKSPVGLVSGSTIRLLAHLGPLQSIRESFFTLLDPQEIASVRVERKGGKVEKFERLNGAWQSETVGQDISTRLRFPIKRFVDEEAAKSKLESQWKRSPKVLDALFSNALGESQHIEVRAIGSQWIAKSSEREGALVEIETDEEAGRL